MQKEQNPLDQKQFAKLYQREKESVAGKAIVVTGGTTGIGRTIALLLVAEGARVLICGRHEKELNDAMKDIKSIGGGEIYGLIADLSKLDDVRKLFKEADSKLGGLDVLVNNAALAAETITESSADNIEYVLQTNIFGYLACAREAAQRMRPKQLGYIINVGSMSAESKGSGSDIYVATKSAVRGFSLSLAKSLAESQIRVTLIEPGLVGSDMIAEEHPPEEQPEKIGEWKMLRSEEIAECVLYCLTQPRRCNIPMIQIRPTKQT